MNPQPTLRESLDRSWTDSLTGTVFLADMNLPANIRQFIDPSARPSRAWLPSYLHESMHHWCFQSPVAQTTALLQCRARRRAAQMLGSASAADRERLLEDVLRSEATGLLLQPLAEGLALFMEFDAVPSTASTLSQPMAVALPSFTDTSWMKKPSPAVSIASQVNRSLFEVLSSVRLSDEFIRRKLNLLAQPLVTDGGGYLAGYLLVKLLRNWALRHSDAFGDSDLAAMFIRHFFYHDWGLVAMLLDFEKENWAAVNGVSLHLQGRFRAFMHCEFETEIKRFEQLFGDEGDPSEREKPYGIAIDPDLMALGVQRFNALLEEFERPISPASDPDADEKLQHFYRQLLHQRHLLRLGVLSVRVTVSEYQRATAFLPIQEMWRFGVSKEQQREFAEKFGGYPIISSAALPGISPGTADGVLELYVLPHPAKTMTVLSRGQEVVAQWWLNDANGEMAKEFADFAPTVLSDALEKDMLEAIAEVLKGSAEELILNNSLENLPDHRNEIYERLALANVPDHFLADCKKAMGTDGLQGLAGISFDVLQTIARLSVGSQFFWSVDRLKKLDQDLEWGAMARLPELDAITAATGFPLFVHNSGALWASV